MIAALIPYFLACNISVDPAWPNGPEYVFGVKRNFTIEWNPEIPRVFVGYDLTFHCRPKNPKTLSCLYKNGTASGGVIGIRPLQPEEILHPRQFEVEFNEKGAENITISRAMRAAGKNFVRTLASQLTVGADLSGKTDQDGVFQVDNSTVERYKMDLRIGYPPDPDYNKIDSLYQLDILPQINKPLGKAIEITKEKTVPVGGVYQTIKIPRSNSRNYTITVLHRVDQLNKRIKISKHSLESYTQETGMIRWREKSLKVIYESSIETTLEDVIPADNPVPEVPDPITISVLEQDILEHYLGS